MDQHVLLMSSSSTVLVDCVHGKVLVPFFAFSCTIVPRIQKAFHCNSAQCCLRCSNKELTSELCPPALRSPVTMATGTKLIFLKFGDGFRKRVKRGKTESLTTFESCSGTTPKNIIQSQMELFQYFYDFSRIESLKPGDLIEVFRPAYQHWAVYIGNEEVVHLSHPNATPSSSLALSSGTFRAVVMRQRIQEVINGNIWRKNNLHDGIFKPREQHIIVEDAIRRVGEKVKYRVTTQNCEHFATELRYGKGKAMSLQSTSLGYLLLHISNSSHRSLPAPVKGSDSSELFPADGGAEDMAEQMLAEYAKPGDLIEVFRVPHNHWALYIGDCDVVHLAPRKNGVGSFSSWFSSSNSAVVKRHKIWEVTNGDDWRINNFLDDKYQPLKQRVIVKEAVSLVGREMPYSVTTQNCQHFVSELRYGKHNTWLVQGAAITGAVLAGVGAVGAGIVGAGVFGVGALGAGIFRAGVISARAVGAGIASAYSVSVMSSSLSSSSR
ncbi:uncharacterized protein V6R79_000447 [Siganus canaliculatus]